METDSVLYHVEKVAVAGGRGLRLQEVQRFPTIGAHGVEHAVRDGRTYLVFPSYYGKRTDVFRWSEEGSGRFELLQTIESDGAGSVECFTIGAATMLLGIAEFNAGVAALYELRGAYPGERFVPWQRLEAPGVGAIAAMKVDDGDRTLLLAASCESCFTGCGFTSSHPHIPLPYPGVSWTFLSLSPLHKDATREHGWHSPSLVFALDAQRASFQLLHTLPTTGAHDVETVSISVGAEAERSRHFAFFSNDKDGATTELDSELYEWDQTSRRFTLRQRVRTDGAHAAEFFSAADVAAQQGGQEGGRRRFFLAVANLGSRESNSYRRSSVVYSFDPQRTGGGRPLEPLQELPTLGATDFLGFSMGGEAFLAVSNEQDDARGGDIESPIWVLAASGGGGGGGDSKKDEL